MTRQILSDMQATRWVLRHRGTGRYWCANDTFESDIDYAMQFDSFQSAKQMANPIEEIVEVEITVRIKEIAYT